jgi:hypothetical protein
VKIGKIENKIGKLDFKHKKYKNYQEYFVFFLKTYRYVLKLRLKKTKIFFIEIFKNSQILIANTKKSINCFLMISFKVDGGGASFDRI